MPFHANFHQEQSLILLDKLRFFDNSYFISNDNGFEISIEYIPIGSSNWDKKDFELVIFENSYLNAENDVFNVYEATLDERIGWIFPITILDSNNNDFSNFQNLNNYKHVAYQKLLERNFKIEIILRNNQTYTLTEIFGDCIICIINKRTASKIDKYSIDNYLLALYQYGYILKNEKIKTEAYFDRADFVSRMRSRNSRVNLRKSNFDISRNSYISALFKNHIFQSDNLILRFIFLYQVVEHLMQLEFEKSLNNNIHLYLTSKTSKNELREAINDITKERELIKLIVNSLQVDMQIREDFIFHCDLFLKRFNSKPRNTLGDKLYDLRNLITHRLRDFVIYDDSVKKVFYFFELLIVEILIAYKVESLNEKGILKINELITNNMLSNKLKSIKKKTKHKLKK